MTRDGVPDSPEVVHLGRPPRLWLREVTLETAGLARLRFLLGVSGLGAVLATIALFLPFHEYEGELHTGLDHGGFIAAIPAAWMVALVVAAWRRPRWGWMLAWAIVGTMAGLFAAGVALSLALAHMFDNLPSRIGSDLHFIGVLGQLLAPLLGLIGVPLEFVRARRRAEAEARDGVPAARARPRARD